MVSSVKSTRIELRATRDDRELIDRAAAALGLDRSAFVLSQGLLAAQRVLADRGQFVLNPEALSDWERINAAWCEATWYANSATSKLTGEATQSTATQSAATQSEARAVPAERY